MIYFLIAIISPYFMCLYLATKSVNRQIQNKKLTDEEIFLIRRLLILNPIFYPEISIIIKHAEDRKNITPVSN
jgi:hypothetical protein